MLQRLRFSRSLSFQLELSFSRVFLRLMFVCCFCYCSGGDGAVCTLIISHDFHFCFAVVTHSFLYAPKMYSNFLICDSCSFCLCFFDWFINLVCGIYRRPLSRIQHNLETNFSQKTAPIRFLLSKTLVVLLNY